MGVVKHSYRNLMTKYLEKIYNIVNNSKLYFSVRYCFSSERHWRRCLRLNVRKVANPKNRKRIVENQKLSFPHLLDFFSHSVRLVRLCFCVLSWIVWIELTLKYESNATNISLSRHILTQRRSALVTFHSHRFATNHQLASVLPCINNPNFDV